MHLSALVRTNPSQTHPHPQSLGLPLRERGVLVTSLARVAAAMGGSRQAAVVSEGLYLAATPEWWAGLGAREALLLQHLVQRVGPEVRSFLMVRGLGVGWGGCG